MLLADLLAASMDEFMFVVLFIVYSLFYTSILLPKEAVLLFWPVSLTFLL